MATRKRPEEKRKVDIKSRRQAYKGRYKIEEVVFDFDRAAGKGRIADAKREIFERGDSAAALIHDIERDVIVLTEQFRIATYAKGPGYILEAMAGSVEEDEDPEDCIRREMMEEVGYKAGELTLVAKGYVSPGATSERIFLYYAPVKTADLIDSKASGLAAEKEDVRRVEFTRADFFKRLDAAKFDDGKIVSLGFWLKSQPRQGKPAKAKAKPKKR
ncbi:MAG: NUDIX domain-containing protein [Hyphomonadaceae bacterium]|nr:NUDIX domain-containing protein [Hyphomonadaceae bacterium]